MTRRTVRAYRCGKHSPATSNARLEIRRPSPGKRGGFDRSMQHHLKDLLFKDGVYGTRETDKVFSYRENRNMEAVEVRADIACDRAGIWQATSHHSQTV